MIEGSIKKTEVGTRIAEETSKALEEIVIESAKVTDLISEIASASKEQAAGIGQINEGLNQVDQVTQQNSASSEELAAASQEMNSQAEMVKQALGKFKLKRSVFGSALAANSPGGIAPHMQHAGGQRRSTGAASRAAHNAMPEVAATSPANPKSVISLDDEDYGKF